MIPTSHNAHVDAAAPTVASLLHWIPGEAHSDVRRDGPGLLQRLEAKARREIDPHAPQPFVRGVGVSMDSLFEAILGNSRASRFVFIVEAGMQEAAAHWQAGAPLVLNGRPAEIVSGRQVVEGGLRRLEPDIWFDARGEMPTVGRIRERFSSRVYPIASVQHGFSIHSLLWDQFTRLLLTRLYPCDSLVCTTKTKPACNAASAGAFS